jgi:hypothetical protein
MRNILPYLRGVFNSTARYSAVFGILSAMKHHKAPEVWLSVLAVPLIWMARDGVVSLWRRWRGKPPVKTMEVK